MLFGPAIKREPEEEPRETNRTRKYECPTPTETRRDPRHSQRCDNRANIRSGVEDSRRERALFLRKPFGDSLDRCGKVSCFTYTERCTSNTKTKRRASQRMGHRRETPPHDREHAPDPRADAVHQPSGQQQAKRIRGVESSDDVAVIDFSPADRGLQIF